MNVDLKQVAKNASWQHSGPLYLLSVFYLVMAGLALYGQSESLMVWLDVDRIPALGVGGAIELLAAVLFAFADWRRTYHGERAIAARVLSVLVALGVAGLNFSGHLGTLGTCALFTGASLAAFAVLVLHTNARRRDALRALGKLPATPPDYGLAQTLRHPWITRRARALAIADPSLGVHGSLAAAKAAIRLERRHKAIAQALRAKLARSVDPTTATIAVHTYDLDRIAARLAAEADYDGLTALVAADITPVLLTASADAAATRRIARKADGDDNSATAKPATRRQSTAERVAKTVAKTPTATTAQVAAKLGVSERTVQRHWPKKFDTTTDFVADPTGTELATAAA